MERKPRGGFSGSFQRPGVVALSIGDDRELTDRMEKAGAHETVLKGEEA